MNSCMQRFRRRVQPQHGKTARNRKDHDGVIDDFSRQRVRMGDLRRFRPVGQNGFFSGQFLNPGRNFPGQEQCDQSADQKNRDGADHIQQFAVHNHLPDLLKKFPESFSFCNNFFLHNDFTFP